MVAVLFFVLNVADAGITAVILQDGIELNPIFRPLMGSWHGYALKLFVAALLALWLHFRDHKALAWCGVAFYIVVVAFNASQL